MPNLNKLLIFALIFSGFAYFWQIHQKDNEIQKLSAENFQLNSDLQQQITIANGKVKILYRDKEVIKYKIRYIPVEAPNTTITTDTHGNVNITGSWYGLTFYPFLGVSTPLQPTLGARIFYFDRYGVSLLVNDKTMGIGIDTRINYGFIQNSACGIMYPLGIYYSVFF